MQSKILLVVILISNLLIAEEPTLAILTSNENDPALTQLPEHLENATEDLKSEFIKSIPELEKLTLLNKASPKPPIIIYFDARKMIQEKFQQEAFELSQNGATRIGQRLRAMVRQALSGMVARIADKTLQKQVQEQISQKKGAVEKDIATKTGSDSVKLVPLFTNSEDYFISVDRGTPRLTFKTSGSPSSEMIRRLGGEPNGQSRVILTSNPEGKGIYWNLVPEKGSANGTGIVRNYVEWRYPHLIEGVKEVPKFRYGVGKFGETLQGVGTIETAIAHSVGTEPLSPYDKFSLVLSPSGFITTGALKLTEAFYREISSNPGPVTGETVIVPTTEAERDAIKQQWKVLLDHEVLQRSGSEDLKKQIERVHTERMKLLENEGLAGHQSLVSLGKFLDEVSLETKKHIDTYGSNSRIALGLQGFPEKVMNFIFEASSGARLYLERKAKRLGITNFRALMDAYISDKSTRASTQFPSQLSADDIELFKASVEIVEALGVMAGYYERTVKKEMLRFDREAESSLVGKWKQARMYIPIVQAIFDVENTDRLGAQETEGRPHAESLSENLAH